MFDLFEKYLCSTSHLGKFEYVSDVRVQIQDSCSRFFLFFGADVALLCFYIFLLLSTDGGVTLGQPNHNALNYFAPWKLFDCAYPHCSEIIVRCQRPHYSSSTCAELCGGRVCRQNTST